MIFVSGNWKQTTTPPPQDCVEIQISGGRMGGNADFRLCGEERITSIYVAPGKVSKVLCVVDNSWVISPGMTVNVFGSCFADTPGDNDKVFTVIHYNMANEVNAYANYDINYDPEFGAIDPFVQLDTSVNCWEITGVVTPLPGDDTPRHDIIGICPR